jgi:hypothetical protein
VHLRRTSTSPQRLRIRGFAHEEAFRQSEPVKITAIVNGGVLRTWRLERHGLFVLEEDVPDAPEYDIRITASPQWFMPPDDRVFTVNCSLIRLVPRDA